MTYYIVLAHTYPKFDDNYTVATHGHSPEKCAQKLGILAERGTVSDAISTDGNPTDGYAWCDGKEWGSHQHSDEWIKEHYTDTTKSSINPMLIYTDCPCSDEPTEVAAVSRNILILL